MSKSLNIHCFIHVPYEGPAVIADWAKEHGHSLHFTRFHEDGQLPERESVDLLVIMGGPMSVYDDHIHPWLQEETEWVGEFIAAGKPVIGICLGAQIIAAALGAEVHPGPYKEIGWFNLRFLPCLGDYRICRELPSVRKVFHWHGDTFTLPEGADRIAESKAFSNQGFILNGRIIALQFHLEVTPASVKALLEHGREALTEGPFIQDAPMILAEKEIYRENQQLMYSFMNYLAARAH
jgi:GMP synthase-like glutamine amidotransferase